MEVEVLEEVESSYALLPRSAYSKAAAPSDEAVDPWEGLRKRAAESVGRPRAEVPVAAARKRLRLRPRPSKN